MSTAIVEQPMAAHTTIYGFSTASPFKAHASEKDGRVGAAATAAAVPLLCPAASEKRCSGLLLSAAAAPQSPQLTRQLSSAVQTPSAPGKHVAWEHGCGGDDADKPGSQQPDSHVGWEALLDCSRHSGSSGVVGAAAAGDDVASLTNVKIEICCTAHTTPAVRRLVKSVARGLRACQDPEQACNGMGGTYFFMNESGGKAAIIKPCDEEPLAPNNPNGYVGRQLGDPGWKPTVRVGEAAMREVAAHLLDHEGFAKVPTSVLVRARHPIFCYNSRMRSVRMSVPDMASMLHGGDGGLSGPLPMKLGSLQEFVQHDCDTSEMGPSRFSARDVHRIGILDVRLFNTDRHAGNMLVRVARDGGSGTIGGGAAAAATGAGKSSFMGMVPTTHELIPIDHGFCLPETLESPYLEWMYWPQAMLAFSDDELAYIRSLDIEADKELLRKELPSLRPECLRVMEVATTLLKRGAEAGLTLFDIANVMTRPFADGGEESSDLEKICAYAKQCVEYRRQANAAGSSDEDDEFDVDCEDEEIDRLSLSTGGGGDTPRAAGLAGISGARELLFDMEEDGGIASLYEVRVDTAAIMAMAAAAVGGGVKASRGAATFSPGTSLSSADASADLSDTLTITTLLSSSTIGRASSTSTNQALEMITPVVTVARIGGLSGGYPQQVPGGAAASALLQQASAATAATQAVARSVHVTEGFLWRNMKGRQSTLRRCTKAVTPKATAAQAYPPPVAAVSPDALNGCFSDMTEDEWGWFMHVYEKQLQEAISSGKWKHGAADTGAAMSCPRF